MWVMPPVSIEGANKLIEGLKILPILEGARGRRLADVTAPFELISSFGDALVCYVDWIDGMDLNPKIVGPKGGGAYAVEVAMFADGMKVGNWSE